MDYYVNIKYLHIDNRVDRCQGIKEHNVNNILSNDN